MLKKSFMGFALMAAFSAPVSLTSCSEDDVNTVLQILDLFLSADQLSNTAWITDASDFAIEFGSGNGNMYDGSSTAIPFTYTLDTETNKLTLTYTESSKSEVWTVVSFTQNTSLVLKRPNGRTYTLKPFTSEE